MIALWSINERLANRPGIHLTQPTEAFLNDLLAVAVTESEEYEAHLDQIRRELS